MNRKLFPLLGIAFVVAVIATGIFYGLIAGKLSDASKSSPRSLVVAARNLEPGMVLGKADVKLSPWTGIDAPSDALPEVEPAVGLTVRQPIKENEAVTWSRLASQETKGGAAAAVPVGMRAVSIHVSESPGVVRLLQPGHRVDVQVIRSRSGANGADADLRTILEAMELLTVQHDQPQGRAAAAVLTLLAKPAEADMLSLADSGARIRVVLRNPEDEETSSLPRRELASLFQGGRTLATTGAVRVAARGKASPPGIKQESGVEAPLTADGEIQLRVRIAGVGAAGLNELTERLLVSRRPDQLQASAFQPEWDLEDAVRRLQAKGLIEILTASYLLTGDNRQVGVQAGPHWSEALECGVRIQLRPSTISGERMRVWVQPEITAPWSEGAAAHKIETEVELTDGQSFLVTGLVHYGDGGCIRERLPTEQPDAGRNRELVVLVTPKRLRLPASSRPTATLLAKP